MPYHDTSVCAAKSPTRRRFLQLSASSLLAGLAVPGSLLPIARARAANLPPWRRHPDFLNLHDRLPSPVPIRALDLVEVEGRRWLRARSDGDAIGLCIDNGRMKPLESLLRQRVIPFFRNRDARDLEELVEAVFLNGSNYKYAGLAFWCSVAFVEIALFDLMARRLEKPVHALLGRQQRNAIPVYFSRFNRDNTAREEVEATLPGLKRHGFRAVKCKVGRRMYDTPKQRRRDVELVHRAREILGPDITIYVDANGSWTGDGAIAFGRAAEEAGLGFIEEPCRWQDYAGTRKAAMALKTPLACGEQDTSYERFEWMLRAGHIRVVQPDVYYNGGFIRALRVARRAARAGRLFTPHSPKTGLQAAANLHLVSVVPNAGAFQEYREADEVVDGRVAVPPGPGLDGRLELAPFVRANPL